MVPLPKEIEREFIGLFGDRQKSAYGQIATVDQAGNPWLRTVHFRWVESRQTVGFVTCTDSPKWQHLEQHPRCSCCYWAAEPSLQVRLEANAYLVNRNSNDADDVALLQDWWLKTRENVRQAYWTEYNAKPNVESTNSIDQLAPTYGAVILHIDRIEWMHFDHDQYENSKRTLYIRSGKQWTKKQLKIVSSAEMMVNPTT